MRLKDIAKLVLTIILTLVFIWVYSLITKQPMNDVAPYVAIGLASTNMIVKQDKH